MAFFVNLQVNSVQNHREIYFVLKLRSFLYKLAQIKKGNPITDFFMSKVYKNVHHLNHSFVAAVLDLNASLWMQNGKQLGHVQDSVHLCVRNVQIKILLMRNIPLDFLFQESAQLWSCRRVALKNLFFAHPSALFETVVPQLHIEHASTFFLKIRVNGLYL